jgi:8-oxo-dGTP pyrophosphatase MutT (NUDIX family)
MQQIRAAGCLFLNNNSEVLMGYSTKYNWFSGFGGKKEENENSWETAMRETIEEFYGIEPSQDLVRQCAALFKHRPFLQRDEYAFLVLSFDDYRRIATLVSKSRPTVPYYDTFPESMFHLIIDRKLKADQEIGTLRILKQGQTIMEDIDAEFLLDWKQALNVLPDDDDGYSTE